MSFISKILHCWWGVSITILLALVVHSLGLNTDGTLLLSFKYNVLNDPFSVLGNWNYEDETPCLWTGVMCTSLPYPGASNALRVVALVLPNNKLLGSIPEDLGLLEHLRHLDLSSNYLNGSLPNSLFNSSELKILDLSTNEISGQLPNSFQGLNSLQLLNLSDNALTDSPGTGSSSNGSDQGGQSGLRPAAIVGIVVGDLAGIGIFSIIFLYVYQAKKKKRIETSTMGMTEFKLKEQQMGNKIETIPSPMESKGVTPWLCLRQKGSKMKKHQKQQHQKQIHQKKNSGSSIVYKAVLEDGTTFAVRRIGEIGVERFKDFENQVKLIGKLQHPNIVRIRGFYWGSDEKLIIYDHVTNGSLANIGYNVNLCCFRSEK
ncbi:hypothetical protein IFM89_005076 [Coptis chinensis]|uniref:Protein kinase domain-containing protein n=1 Tax=Coptis chinensis TaxID=261450 RepID=A0A835HL33_9MAGN|nr:hypothetical protein IFM89_005076 [Coptis chinensis]